MTASLENQGAPSSPSSQMANPKPLRGELLRSQGGFKNQNPFAESDPLALWIHSVMLWEHKTVSVAGAELPWGHKTSYWRQIRGIKQKNKPSDTKAWGKVQGICIVTARVHLGWEVNRDGWGQPLKLGLDCWKHTHSQLLWGKDCVEKSEQPWSLLIRWMRRNEGRRRLGKKNM